VMLNLTYLALLTLMAWGASARTGTYFPRGNYTADGRITLWIVLLNSDLLYRDRCSFCNRGFSSMPRGTPSSGPGSCWALHK
jgi:hypothetical protein